jgi:hypothetical protein
MGKVLEDRVERPGIINRSLLRVTDLPMDA